MNTKRNKSQDLARCVCIGSIVIVLCLSTVSLYGQIWGPSERITTSGSGAVRASIAVFEHNIHVTWMDYRDGPNGEIYYKRSNDSGQTWTPGDRISNDPARSEIPSIAVVENNVHIVWMDDRHGNFEIYYRRSTNNGDFFHPEVRLTTAGSVVEDPSIAVIDSSIHIVWADYRHGGREIYYKRSTDNGLGWTPGIRLTNDSAESLSPRIGLFGDHVYVVWSDYRDGDSEVYYKRSTDGGLVWHPDARQTFTGTGIFSPTIAVFENTVHLAWTDLRNSSNGEIYYKRSLDNGTTWNQATRLTFDAAESQTPSIVAFFENVHIVWCDDRDTAREIYYKGSFDNGENWEPDTRLTSHISESRIPAVAAFGEDIHIVWEDSRPGKFEIYYKHGAFPVGIEEPIEGGPDNFSLFQNYPNPFNAETGFRYSIPEPARVNLRIYDILGRTVDVLVDSEQESGYHTVRWNVENIASGVYFYRLTAGEYSLTKRMVFMK